MAVATAFGRAWIRAVGMLVSFGLLALPAGLGGCARRTAGPDAAPGGTIAIATQSPLIGPLSPLGRGIADGARLAVEENRERFRLLGFDLELVAYDDADPGQGIANAELILADRRILGVVGHLNSETAIPASEKYNQDGLVLVSPANTAVELTERGLPTVNRLVARDDAQGRAAAAFAAGRLRVRTAYVVHDRTTYGQGLADAFKAAAEGRGVQVKGYRGIVRGRTSFIELVEEVTRLGPELIYFAGMPGDGGRLLRALRGAGFKGIFLGGDAVGTREMVRAAGDVASAVYFTSVVTPLHVTDPGRRWAERYRARFGDAPEAYAAVSYDAARILLQGIEEAIRDGGGRRPTRAQVSRVVRRTRDFEGIAGRVAFDERGDNRFATPESIRVYVFRRKGI